jgi:hypothetical protein
MIMTKSVSYSFLVCDRCLQRGRLSSSGENHWIEDHAFPRLSLNAAKYGSRPFTLKDADDPMRWLLSFPEIVLLFKGAKKG